MFLILSLKQHIKFTLELAYPIIIGQLGLIMMGVVDSVMVGELGATPLAASALANSYVILIFIVGLGVSFAVTPLVAIEVGARRKSGCGVLFRQSLIVNMIIGFLTAVFTFFASYLLVYFDQPEAVVELAQSYTVLIGISALPLMLFQTYKQFIEGLSIMRPAMIITLIANIINIFANWIFIYGNLGMPALGLDGAGIATLSSRIFMAWLLMFYVTKAKYFKQFDVSFHFKNINFPVIKKILKLGLPSGFQYFFEVGAFSFAVVMVGWLGTKQLAAHQIAINLASISFMAVLGISAAGAIRVGNAVGKQNIKEIRRAGFTALVLGPSIMAFAGIIFVILRNYLPSLYVEDNDVISIASTLLVIAALFQLSDGTQAVGIGVLRGLTDVKGPTIITFIAYWIIGLPIGYYLGFNKFMGVEGIWIGLSIGLTASAIMLTLRFNAKSKQAIAV